tara:strand:- start:216 stop:569 length:354 start_codon:yes stop_codon:yes gene_type:complete
MSSLSIVVVYHPNCKPSTDFLIAVSKLTTADLEYINIKDVSIETDIDVNVVPLIIIDNDPTKIFKGKDAFDKIEELIEKAKNVNNVNKESGGIKYGRSVKFVEQSDGKKEKIDLSKR